MEFYEVLSPQQNKGSLDYLKRNEDIAFKVALGAARIIIGTVILIFK